MAAISSSWGQVLKSVCLIIKRRKCLKKERRRVKERRGKPLHIMFIQKNGQKEQNILFQSPHKTILAVQKSPLIISLKLTFQISSTRTYLQRQLLLSNSAIHVGTHFVILFFFFFLLPLIGPSKSMSVIVLILIPQLKAGRIVQLSESYGLIPGPGK